MKLLIILVLASVLVLKTAEGADVAGVDTTCKDGDTCTAAHATCKDKSDGNGFKCYCDDNYKKSGDECKLSNGQGCGDNAVCASGFCNDNTPRKCGSKVALDATCTDVDKCTAANSECKDDSGTKKCLCKVNYEKTGDTCKLSNGHSCSTNDECAKGECASDIKKCGKANDKTCANNDDCASGNCKTMETDSGGTEKKCADGASAIVASVLLMVSALVTSRFL